MLKFYPISFFKDSVVLTSSLIGSVNDQVLIMTNWQEAFRGLQSLHYKMEHNLWLNYELTLADTNGISKSDGKYFYKFESWKEVVKIREYSFNLRPGYVCVSFYPNSCQQVWMKCLRSAKMKTLYAETQIPKSLNQASVNHNKKC